MLNITPSAATPTATDDTGVPPNGVPQVEVSAVERKPEETKKRIPLASIPTTISIGLLIAVLYLGGRILSARHSAKPSPAALSSAAPVAVNPPIALQPKEVPPVTAPVVQPVIAKPVRVASQKTTPAQASPVVADDDSLPTITPQLGKHYIQVGALDLDAEATHRFVQRLRNEKYDPHIAPGPSPALMRVLIGPFDDLEALNEKKAQLESEGLQTFVRKY